MNKLLASSGPSTISSSMVAVAWLVACSVLATASQFHESISFPADRGETLQADLYGVGQSGVVLIGHGGYSTKESWEAQARTLAAEGFRVLSFTTRAGLELKATGRETECLYDEVCLARDVLAAVRYLRQHGAKTVAVIGGSMGGAAAAQASVAANTDEIDRSILLAPAPISSPEQMKGSQLFIATRDDANTSGPRLPGIQSQYERVKSPKRLIVLDGSAHGQRIFETKHRDRVMTEIIRFLGE